MTKDAEKNSGTSTQAKDEQRSSRNVTRITLGALVLVLGASAYAVLGRSKAKPTVGAATGTTSIAKVAGAPGGLKACDPDGNACRELGRGAAVPRASLVTTDYTTRAELDLGDGSRILLDRATKFALGDGSHPPKLLSGGIIADSADSKSRKLELELPVGKARLEGGKFSIRTDAEQASCDVVRGSATLDDRAGNTIELHAGSSGRLFADNPPTSSQSPSFGDALGWSESLLGEREAEPSRGLGELTARKPGETQERRGAVVLASHVVRVRIAGAVARTEVEEVFENQTGDVLEGIFRFPLPPDAQIERLALDVDGKLEEGAFVDRERAAAIFRGAIHNAAPKAPPPREEIVWVPGPWRDPALLEWQRGGRFELRIFPIPKRGKRSIVLAYTQTVPEAGKLRRFSYPLAYDPGSTTKIGQFRADFEVRGHDPKIPVRASGYPMNSETRGDAQALTFERSSFSPSGDVTLEYAMPDRDSELSAFSYTQNPGSSLVAISLRPKLPRAAASSGEAMALVVDRSRSMYGEAFRRASDLASRIALELDRDARLFVLACDSECEALSPNGLPGGSGSAEQIKRFLSGMEPEGASDLVAALRAGQDSARSERDRPLRVIYIGDGAPTMGEVRPGSIERAVGRFLDRGRTSISSVAVGSESDLQTLRAAARAGGGVMLPYAPGRSTNEMALGVLGAVLGSTLADVHVELPHGLEAMAPSEVDAIPAGGEAWIAARLTTPSVDGTLVLRGRVGDRTFEQRYPLNVRASDARANAFVPRIYAAARISDLERDGSFTAKQEAVGLSSQFHVASRFTSLLVLESETMLKAFGLDAAPSTDTWTGDESAQGSSANGTLEVDEDADALSDLEPSSGRSSAEGRLGAGESFGAGAPAKTAAAPRAKKSFDAFDSAPASAPSPRGAPAPAAPAPAQEMARAEKPEMAPNDAILPDEEVLLPRTPPRRRMIPMRKTWERFGEIFVDRFTPKLAGFDALANAERLASGDSPRQKDVKNLYVLAMLSGDIERAAAVAERWANKEPLDAEALTARADVAARRGQRERALRLLESVIDMHPNDVAGQKRLARLERWAGRVERGCRHLLAIAELRPHDAALLSEAVRCSRFGADSATVDNLLVSADAQTRKLTDALLSKPAADDSELRGDLRLEATFDGASDVDLGLIDPDGNRISWLGAPTRAVISARDTTSTRAEGLALRGGKPGEYVLEVVRGRGPGRTRGEISVSIAGASRRLPFVLDGERVTVALLRIGTREKLVPLEGFR